MKTSTWAAWLVIAASVAAACEDKAQVGNTEPQGGAAGQQGGDAAQLSVVASPGASSTEPGGLCAALVAAAAAGDVNRFLALCTPGSNVLLADERVKALVLQQLKTATCGTVTAGGEKATARATIAGEFRDLALRRVGGSWRFDLIAYVQQFPIPEAPPKGEHGETFEPGQAGEAAGPSDGKKAKKRKRSKPKRVPEKFLE